MCSISETPRYKCWCHAEIKRKVVLGHLKRETEKPVWDLPQKPDRALHSVSRIKEESASQTPPQTPSLSRESPAQGWVNLPEFVSWRTATKTATKQRCKVKGRVARIEQSRTLCRKQQISDHVFQCYLLHTQQTSFFFTPMLLINWSAITTDKFGKAQELWGIFPANHQIR